MKIGELLELTQSKALNKIAKEKLTIGEKPAREALKAAGCFSISGKRGWLFEGDPSVLEQSIYNFAPAKKIVRKPKANVSTKETSNETNKEEIKQANEQVATTLERKHQRSKEQTKERSVVVRKRSSFDLDVDLLKELKIQAVLQDKNVYEMVEIAIRQYLAALKRYS